jgi:hypothetical protein
MKKWIALCIAVGIRGLLPHVNIPDKATDKHG